MQKSRRRSLFRQRILSLRCLSAARRVCDIPVALTLKTHPVFCGHHSALLMHSTSLRSARRYAIVDTKISVDFCINLTSF